VIFDPTTFSIGTSDLNAYTYDETSDRDGKGLWVSYYDENGDGINDPEEYVDSTYLLTPFSEKVVQIAVAASSGETTVYDSASGVWSFTYNFIDYDGGEDGELQWPDSVETTLTNSGVTEAEARSGTITHTVLGQCLTYGGISNGLYRALGIPSRMASGIGAGGWNYHVWDEIWLDNPPDGTDNWYVFDATPGHDTRMNRPAKGDFEDPDEVWIANHDFTGRIDVISDYQ
jgi:transglutaminase-like putative cysteine protease